MPSEGTLFRFPKQDRDKFLRLSRSHLAGEVRDCVSSGQANLLRCALPVSEQKPCETCCDNTQRGHNAVSCSTDIAERSRHTCQMGRDPQISTPPPQKWSKNPLYKRVLQPSEGSYDPSEGVFPLMICPECVFTPPLRGGVPPPSRGGPPRKGGSPPWRGVPP